MICILILLPEDLKGPCFIGFAIGESLGASALRICGGIFTKIADIGSDLMKIVFKLPEDDPKNPGVVADCTGDNAGDSVGPTADGFETYGVTGVALISFLALALGPRPSRRLCAKLMTWIFVMRIMMDFDLAGRLLHHQQVFSSQVQQGGRVQPGEAVDLAGLDYLGHFDRADLLRELADARGHQDASGTAQPAFGGCSRSSSPAARPAGALIPEFTKFFTSTEARARPRNRHRLAPGRGSLNILSGPGCRELLGLLGGPVDAGADAGGGAACQPSGAGQPHAPRRSASAARIFAFGLVAFGFLGMGPSPSPSIASARFPTMPSRFMS